MKSRTTKTLKQLAKDIRDIDFTMLTTLTADGTLAARPMSNNGEVEYDGDSYYFAWANSRVISDVMAEPRVGLSFQGSKGLLGAPPLFVSVQGRAEVIRDKTIFTAHWTSGLDRWFEQGVDTPGVAMIRVRATRIHYWDAGEEGEVEIGSPDR